MKQTINLLSQIKVVQQKKITGKLKIDNSKNLTWTLYFYQGRLIWATGGVDPYQTWKRNLFKYCPDIDNSEINLIKAKSFDWESYNSLSTWHHKKIIASKQLICLIENQLIEIVFDILFAENNNLLIYQIERGINSCLEFDFKNILILVNGENIYQQSYQIWLQWIQKDLQLWSPNLIPIINQQEQLKQLLPANIYDNLIKLIDGKNTLRDLAAQMNKDIVELTYSLKSYVQKGIIRLIEAPEILLSPSNSKKSVNSKQEPPLIVCVDDSLQVLQIMKYILTTAGYKFMGIQDPIQTVPKLVSCNPKLIFLDIAMPTINGYELCAQLQRVSKLRDIPVVMLTGNNGIIDRIRAKIVGTSSFLSKPIVEEKVLAIVKDLITNDSLKQSSPINEQKFSNNSAIAM